MGQKAKIVMDTNVWISIILNKTLGHEFNDLINKKRIQIFASEETLNEIAKVLNYSRIKIYLDDARISIRQVLVEIIKNITTIKPTEKINQIKKDVSDNMFLECAVEAKVDFIVSGDIHLLSLKKFRNIKIITPREFLKIMYET